MDRCELTKTTQQVNCWAGKEALELCFYLILSLFYSPLVNGSDRMGCPVLMG